MDFKNSDITSGPVITDLNGADAAVALEAAATLAVAMQAGNILPLTADGQLVLPAGVGLDDIKVIGRDLVIQMPDGTQMIVPDGAVFVPQIVVDGVAVPPLNIAALLIGQEPQPAAGRPQSSGGNFADAVGDIGDPFGLGDLLPPTQLAFPGPEEREIIPGLIDEEPTTIIITPDQPAGSVSATASVNEAALPARGSEPAGSNEASNAETTTGSIVFDAPDGLGSITLNGVAITAVGQVFVTPLGRLTITSIAPGNIGYSYTLTDNTTNPVSNDIFAVVVTDSDGDTASANLTINIIDDAPTARNDTDSVPAANYTGQTGNVITGVGTTSGSAGADTQGADGAVLSGVRAGTGAGTFAAAGSTINGQYGTLTIAANGSYTYTRNAGTPGGVNDVFTYQITDGDGDSSTATLTISIADSPVTITSVPTTGAGTVVDEAGLPARGTEPPGSNAAATSESTSGTITFTAPDGVASVQINGITITGAGQVITVPTGTLLITGYNPATGTLGYTFTLTDNTSGDATTQVFSITVTDTDGDTATSPFTVRIIDDVPTARNDSGTQTAENAPVTVNVIANDTQGADGVNLATGVALVAGSLSGAGTLVYNANGTFTYTPAPGEQGVVTFNYTITDGDGDVSTATVTINLLEDSTPMLRIAGDSDVNESGLPARGSEPAGSDSAANSEIANGTIAVATGGDSVASLVINGVNVTAGGTVNTALGTLVVTLSGGIYSYSYTLTDNTLAATSNDTFTVVLTDSDGDTASSNLVIAIIDDAPTAIADTDSIVAGQYGPATGNVISDSEGDGGKDVQGADGVTVTNVSGAGGSGGAGTAVNGLYGVLTLNADGSYSYVRNAGTPGGVSDVFTYTITDGDGDTSSTTLTIAIADSPVTLTLPVKGAAGTVVDEAGLPSGSNAVADSEKTNGTINYVAADGPATVTIDGVAVTAVGQTFTGSFGTLKITSIANGVIGYEYLLATNTSGDATFDDFAIVVTDQDGDSSNGTLVIDIVDDVPTARPDVDSVIEDDFSGESESVSADGNVITGVGGSDANATDGVADTKGADGASVTGVAFGATAGAVGGSTAGAYGTLFLNADGSYRYVLNNFDPKIQGLDSDESLTEVFSYTITDGDGDARTTTLTITINGSDDPITINGLNIQGPELVVDDDDLPDGSSPNAAALTKTGSFTVNGVDGIASIKVAGVEVFVGQTVTTATGTFTITAISAAVDGSATGITISYSFTLNDNTPHPTGNGENTITESFLVTVTDTDGSTDSDTIDVLIIDDVPNAVNDLAGPVAENAPVTVNVIANDISGADGVNLVTGVALVGGSLTGTGTLVYNADGTFTYTPSAGEQGLVTFNYQITDGDGDTSVATVTIDLGKDSTPTLRASDSQVDEEALADGSNPASNAESTTGSIAITTGNDGIGSLVIDGVNVTAGGVVVGAYGTLTVTLSAGIYSYSYTLTDNTTDHPINPTTGTPEGVFDDFNIVLTDSDGDVATDTITIDILDDGPTARNDIINQDVENTAITFDVFGNDTFGADGVDIDNNPGVAVTFTQPATGSVSYNPATGLFTFTPVPGQLGTVTYTYTIIDGDGDPSTATVTINLKTDSIPTVRVTDVTVNEDGLPARAGEPAGTSFGSNSHVGAGSFSITTGGDTLQKLEIKDGLGNWINVTAGGVVNGANGTLVVSVVAGVYSYTYTLSDNLENHPDFVTIDGDGISDAADPLTGEAFDVRVTDSDNSVSAIDTLNVTVLDDAPTATAEAARSVVEGTTVSGVFDFVAGADGAGVSHINAVALVFGVGGWSQWVDLGSGEVRVQANGNYEFKADAVTLSPVAPITGTFTVTDGDNDTVVRGFEFDITDANTPTAGSTAASVDDDGLAGGNAASTVGDLVVPNGDGDNNESTFGGTLGGSVGLDGAGANGFSFGTNTTAIIGLETVTYSLVGNVLTAKITTSPDASRLNTTLFTVEITNKATGAYKVTLVDNVLHADGPNDEATDATAAINYTITDADGSVVPGSTLTITFDDDAPTATAEAARTVAEDAADIGGNVLANDTQGADGATVTSVTINTAGGSVVQAIAAVGTTTVTTSYGVYTFTAAGVWTFNPSANLNNAAGVNAGFSYEITDGDGDKSKANQPITVTDGANPTTTKSAVIALDEEGLGTPNATGTNALANSESASDTVTFNGGSDNIATVVFGSTAGITLTGYAGTAITWSAGGGNTVTGTIGGITAITLTLSSVTTGATAGATVIATLSDNFIHQIGLSENTISISGVTVVATDTDGDTAAAAVAVTVKDDIPLATAPKATVMTNATGATGGNFLDADNDVDNNYGADGGKMIFTAASITALQGQNLTSGFAALSYSISPDGTLLTATKTLGAVTSTVFTIALQPTGSADQYVVTMVQPLDAAQTVDFNGGGYNFVGSNGSWAGFTQPAVANSDDILLTPIGGGTVNTNANEGGVATGNSVGSGESMRVDFVKDLVGSPVPGGNFYGGDDTQSFTGHYTVNGAGALFTSINSSTTITLKAFDDADTGTLKNVGDGAADVINKISITHGAATQLIMTNGTYVIDGISYTVTFSGGIVTVGGVADNSRIAGFTANGFNSIEFGYVSGNTFKIGDFGASVIKNQPVNFTVPLTITDNDGDSVPSGTLAVTLNPPAAPLAPLSLGSTEVALPGDAIVFALDQQLNMTGSDPAVNAVGTSRARLAAVETASPAIMSLVANDRAAEQVRNSGNVTATVIAASLVGLAALPEAAAAATPGDARLDMLPDMETGMPDQVVLIANAGPQIMAGQADLAAGPDIARVTGDAASNLQAVDDVEPDTGLIAQPVMHASDLIGGGAEVVAISDIAAGLAPITGGDAVLHNVLDIAAAGLTAGNDNPVTPSIENLVNEALPDTTVDRLLDAFEGDSSPPVVADGGTDHGGYLLELINQTLSSSPDFATIHVDPFGSQAQDMATVNNG